MVPTGDCSDWAASLIHSRSNVSPRRLVEPGPQGAVLEALLEAACAAPDHGQLRPWRLVLVPTGKRDLLAAAFEQALLERDPQATAEQRMNARDKAFRAPVLLLAIAQMGIDGDADFMSAATGTGTRVHDHERLVALGCALQNILLMAHAYGFGAGLTSGQAMQSAALRELFALQVHEHAVCCLNIGTVFKHKPRATRAPLGEAFSSL